MNTKLVRILLLVGVIVAVITGGYQARAELGAAWSWLSERASIVLTKPAGPLELPDGHEPAPRVELAGDGWCKPHGAPEDQCAACGNGSEPQEGCLERLPVVRLSSPDMVERIGLKTAPVEQARLADTITGNAELAYDEHAYAEVLPRVAGIVREVNADHGRKVKAGDVLCVIDSAEVGAAKAAYLGTLPLVRLAEATLKRTAELTKAKALPLKDELEAQTALVRAQAELLNATQRLRNLGFSDAELSALERDRNTSSLLRVVSPIEGTVIERHLVPGEAVAADTQVVLVVDLQEMWAWIDVREVDITRVKPGQKVTLTLAGLPGREFGGSVHWIDSSVNPTTRTIRVIAELENRDDLLRANQFGRATITVGPPREAVLVPYEAVQTFGGLSIVFLPQADGSYRAQRVEVRSPSAPPPDKLEVAWGARPGQVVVTTGSFLLKSELVRATEGIGGEE